MTASSPERTRARRTASAEVELQVLRDVAKGLSNAEIGQVMALERRTVRTRFSHIDRKVGGNSHVDSVVQAVRAGLVEV